MGSGSGPVACDASVGRWAGLEAYRELIGPSLASAVLAQKP